MVIFNDYTAIFYGLAAINRGELSAELLTVIVGFNTLGNKSTPTSNRVSSPRKTLNLKG